MSEEINDRLERIGSGMIYDIVAEGGHDAYEKLVLKIPTQLNDVMRRGMKLELPMMEWAAEDNGWSFRKAETVRWEQDGVPYRDTPDFWIQTNGTEILAEVKTHNMWMFEDYGDEFSGDVPDRVFCQAQFHCAANDTDECRVISSFGGEKPLVFIVQRDPVVWKNIHKACVAFWENHVKTKTPPPVDGSAECTSLLNRTPRANESLLEPIASDIETHKKLEKVKGQIKSLEAEKDELCNYFKDRIGENLGIANDALRYTWKANKPSTVINYKGLINELSPDPELLAKYTKTEEGNRVLRNLKPKKGNK